jgi:O-antigen ligase
MIANLDFVQKPWLPLIPNDLSGRMEIYRNAGRIARDFPLFGTGAGTFMSAYKLYRGVAFEQWQAYAHNDWLETRITFGWLGYALILLMLVCMGVLTLASRGMPIGLPLKAMITLGILGCLVQALFDFPFQIYSIVFLFVTFCSILSISHTKVSF